MKKSVGIIALTLATGIALGATGCARNAAPSVLLNSNWYPVPGFKDFQPTFVEGNEKFSAERITYDINFIKPQSSAVAYSVNYENGKYITTFYATKFDASKFNFGEYANSYTEPFTAYYYKTELNADVTYTLGEENYVFTGDEGNKVITECYFRSVGEDLTPLYSKMSVRSVSPANLQTDKKIYEIVDRVYENFYSFDCSSVTSYMTVNEADDRYSEYGTEEYPNPLKSVKDNLPAELLFDNLSLDIVARAMNLTPGSTLSQGINLYSQAGGVQNYSLSGGSSVLGDIERAEAAALLQENGLYKPEYDSENKEKGLETYAVAVTYTGALSGVSQVYWFASVSNNRNNRGRATLVKYSVPLTYGLGTLEYKISSIQSTLWNN